MDKYLQVMQAIRFLAGCCDGARQQDGVGFNGSDSRTGKQLAQASLTIGWNQRQMNDAVWMLQKYRRQIEGAGLQLPQAREVLTVKGRESSNVY